MEAKRTQRVVRVNITVKLRAGQLNNYYIHINVLDEISWLAVDQGFD